MKRNRTHLVFLLVGLSLMAVGDIISFQNNQAAKFIGTLSSDAGLLLTFLQFFVPSPLFPLSGSRQNSSSSLSVPKTASPFSHGTCSILIARGVCSLLLGIVGGISFFAFTSAVNAYVIQFLTSVDGGIVFLLGISTILIALQEWNVPRRRRWFLLEGIFGSLAGWSFMSTSATGALSSVWSISSPSLLGNILLAFTLLFFVFWIVTTGIGEIRASNGWALTAGGVLTIGEIGAIIGSLAGNGAMAFLAFFCYPMLFGVASILGAFKDRGGSSVGGPNIPPLFQFPQHSQKKRFLMIAAVWLIIVGGTFFYSLTRIVEEQVASTALAQQVGNPYGGSLVISDPLNEYGLGFGGGNGLGNGNGNKCTFEKDGYHVSGQCDSDAAIPPKFAFEIVLTSSQSCSGIGLFFRSDSFTIGVCQDGDYILYSDSDFPSGSASSMHTATGQSNLIGIVADGMNMTLYINQVKVASVSDTVTGTGSLDLEGLDSHAALLSDSGAIGNSLDYREVVYTNALLWSK